MRLSSVRINLCGSIGPFGSRGMRPEAGANGRPGETPGRLRAFCSLTFDDTFVVRDVKLIEGHEGLFLAMPSRKLCDRCKRCGEKNHLRARFCNQCGSRLDESRHTANGRNGGATRIKLHADVAHPINAGFRESLERQVLAAYEEELERSHQPGYVPPELDHDLCEEEHAAPGVAAALANGVTTGVPPELMLKLRPTAATTATAASA